MVKRSKTKKTTADAFDRITEKFLNTPFSEYGLGGKFLILGTMSMLLVVSFGVPYQIFSESSEVEQTSSSPNSGTGGSVYYPLNNDFVFVDNHYSCNGQEWGIKDGYESTTAYYSSSTLPQTGFQLDFSLSSSSPDFVVGRSNLFEIVFGEGGKEYFSLKSLLSGELLELSLNGEFDGIKSRIRLPESLINSNLNTLFVGTKMIAENKIRVTIELNGSQYISEELEYSPSVAYNNLYLSLTGSNSGTVFLPTVGPCSGTTNTV